MEVFHGRARGSRDPGKISSGGARVTEFPLSDEEKSEIVARLHTLELEHHDLDDIIDRLAADPAQDQLQLRRLKKRKLVLKDQIQKLRTRLIPDLTA
jgi:hypothetical protein